MKFKFGLSHLCVLLAGILWGVIGLFVRGLESYGFESLEITAIRSTLAAIIMGVFLLIYNRSLFKIRLKDLWCFVGTGIVSLTFFNLCYFKAISMTSLSVAAILLYTAPSMVMLMSALLFKETLTKKKLLSVVLAFCGCVMVTGVFSEKASISLAGILIGLGSGLGYALYSIFGRYAINRGYESLTITFYTMSMSAIASVWFIKPEHVVKAVAVNAGSVIIAIMLAIISTCLPYILYTFGLKGMEGGLASVIASIEPVTATILGFVIFGEIMGFTAIVGIVLVLLSIAIVSGIGNNKK